MARVLTGNVWINDVFYTTGMSETDVGDAAGSIGDHLWREVAAPSAEADVAAVPVTVEPEPESQPDPEPVPDEVPEPVTVPDEPADAPTDIPLPRKGGKGSSAAHWADYARANGVDVEPGSNRDDIIDQLSEAGIATE